MNMIFTSRITGINIITKTKLTINILVLFDYLNNS